MENKLYVNNPIALNPNPVTIYPNPIATLGS